MATNNDDKNLPSRSRFGSRNDNTKSIKGNKETEYELMNIDVKKAERDIKQIFKTATDELSKFQKQQETQTKKLVDNTQKSYQNMFNNITKNYEKSMSNLSAKNASNALGGGSSSSRSLGNSSPSNSRTDKLASQLEELTKEFRENSIGSLNKDRLTSNRFSSALEDKINKTFETGLNKLTKGVKDESIKSSRALKSEFTKLTDAQIKGMDKLNKIAPILESVADGINKVLENWLDRFKTGMNNITSTYESTYSKVAVLTDINQENYQNWQNDTVKTLQQQGLDNNITISNIMEKLSDVTERGITDMQKASEIALQNSITKSITPYLDVTTDAYTDLQMRLGTKFVKNMEGVGKAVSDSVGQQRFINKNLDTMISQLEPVSINAKSDVFDKQFAEQAAILEGLVAQGVMTSSEAENVKQKVYSLSLDQYGTLQNGSAADIVTLSKMYEKGIDPSSDISSTLQEYLTTASGMMDMADRSGATGTLYGNIVGENLIGNSAAAFWNKDMTDMLGGIFDDAEEAGNSLSTASDTLRENLTNDKYNTATQLKSNYAENAVTWLATFKEAYPDWYTFLGSIASGIKTLVTLWVADKAVSGISNLLGGGGSSTGGGILKGVGSKVGSVASKGASAVGSGLSKLGGGLATGSTGTVASGLAVAGGALAGGAMAVKGGMDVYNDIQSGNVNAGTAMSGVGAVGGAVGAGAMLALGASNPVGWIALAIGGIALLGRAAYDSANSYKAAGENVEKEFNSMKMTLQDEIDQREDYLSAIKDDLDDQDTIEQARSKLIESGLLTEEEVNEARTANKDSLEKLTDKYLAETGRLSDDANELMDKYKDIDKDNANNVMSSIKDWYDENKNIENQTNFDTMYDMVEAVMQDENLSKLSEDDQEFAKKQWSKIQEKDRSGKLKQADLEWFLDRGTNGHLFYDTVEGSDLENFTRRAQNNGASIEKYSDLDASKISEYILPLQNLLSDENATKDQAEAALKNAKNAGMERSKYSEIQEVMDKFGIESYKTGLDYVPSDDYIANLHEGESILTKDASEVLRSFGSGISKKSGLVSAISKMFNIATDPLKNIVGQGSSSDITENNSSKEIVDAIYYQTTVLEKAINNINTTNSQSAVAGAIKNATGMISLKTNYDSNMINLTPVMST